MSWLGARFFSRKASCQVWIVNVPIASGHDQRAAVFRYLPDPIEVSVISETFRILKLDHDPN